ncbi:flavin reductase family protein [Amycolatopsis sacchari]|uniref:flavin reductase family protein n=1 Tax=Amycolatopsis sacchari TaxID=115433 RepID=UPI003D735E7C
MTVLAPAPGLRRTLARFTTGVTVVTTVDSTGAVHGMTANAFTSVSLDPPLVLVAIARRARTHDRITAAGRYGVSVLAEQQEALSRRFAGTSRAGTRVEFAWQDGIPLVEGCLAGLSCTVRDSHVAGDHVLHVGEVTALSCRDGRPLVFYGGAFRTLEELREDAPWGF